jgi:multidrug resistance efflux pump
VLVESGDEVGPGAPLVRIHSSELQLELDHRRRELLRLREQVDGDEAEDDAALQRSISVLWQRRQLTRERLELKDNEYARRKRLLDDVSSRVLTGSAPEIAILEQQAQLQATREARLGIVDAKSELDGDIADRRSARQERARQRQARLAEAEALVEAAESQLRLATVEAPGAGWIESLLVVPGSLVQPGMQLGRLVPRVAPRRVVALVALDEARHVQVGSEALVELSPAPSRKSRRLPAIVHHVSREVAPHADVQQLLGEPTADRFVQVEIELLETPEYLAVSPLLRSGSTAVIELVSPERTLGDVVLQTIESWLPAGWLPERRPA